MTQAIPWMLACSVSLLGACVIAAETTPQAAPVVRVLESRYHNARTLKAVFLERYSDGARGAQLESGTVYFSRPGRMRWEYESPENKLFLADGKTVWFFVPADHTATRAPLKESADWRTPLLLLTENVRLSQLCERIGLAEQQAETAGRVTLRCTPRGEKRIRRNGETNGVLPDGASPSTPFDQVLIEVVAATGDLTDVRVFQPGGVQLEYRFGNWQTNIPLAESLFAFQPPVGVAIVDASTTPAQAP